MLHCLCRREKNRIAARQSRARKLQCLMSLQTDVAALQHANALLQAKIEEVAEQATDAQRHYLHLKVAMHPWLDVLQAICHLAPL